MHKNNNIFTAKIAILFAVSVLIVAFSSVVLTKKLAAGFSKNELRTHVVIDGVDFGAFESINYLDELIHDTQKSGKLSIISLKRNFITDQSLYVWAKNSVSDRTALKNVQLEIKNNNNDVVSRVVLQRCQPISWSLETVDPASGGFYEKIDLAVQKVEIK